MKLEVIAREDTAEPDWEAASRSFQGAWFWHRPPVQDALSTWRNTQDLGFAVLCEGRLAGIVPLFSTRRRSSRSGIPFTALSSMGGPAIDPSLDSATRKDVLNAMNRRVIQVIRQTRPRTWTIRGSALSEPIPELVARDQQTTAALNLNTSRCVRVIDVRRGPDQLWSDMEKRARNGVNNARREGVDVSKDESFTFEDYYNLHRSTYERTGVPAHPKEYFESIWGRLIPEGSAHCYVARWGGNVVAAVLVAEHGTTAYYWTNASSPDGLKTNANLALQWKIFNDLHDSGIASYETGDVLGDAQDPKLRSLDRFKRSLGGTEVPLQSLHEDRRHILNSLTRAKQWITNRFEVARR